MSVENSAEAGQRALANRAGVSRKLLARKARETTATQLNIAPLESDFPTASDALRHTAGNEPAKCLPNRRALAQQLLRPGAIQPNPDTVIGAIVGIVANRGQLSRADLVEEMRQCQFPHPSARPQDEAWCQGYVAGAIRQGFLAPG